MPRIYRVIHWDDPEVRAAEERPDNPLRDIPQLPRVWFDGNFPKPVTPGQTWSQFVAEVKEAGIVFVAGLPTPTQVHLLAKAFTGSGVDCSKIKLITDWENWSRLMHGLAENDFEIWRWHVKPWPGPVGNYGNAEGKHVEEHPHNEVALSWKWLRDIGGVSCPTCYDLGLTPNGLAKTLAVCRSTRKPNPPKARPVLAFIKNPSEYRSGELGKFLKSAGDVDIALWMVSPLHEAKYRSQKAAWIHSENREMAEAIQRSR